MLKHGDVRRTEIVRGSDFDIEDEDLIPEEQVIITLTNKSLIASVSFVARDTIAPPGT